MTMTMIGTVDLDEAAKEAAGNWQRFSSFAWHRAHDMDDADNWAIIYTHNRDSGLLDQSNAAGIEKALEPFTDGDDPDVVFECHNHWAVGHVDGFSIRVFKDGEITEAFKTCHDIYEALADYPVLDDEDYSAREYEATLANLESAGRSVGRDYILPDEWVSEVYEWLSENCSRALENRDDQGGYPSDDELIDAFEGLGYEVEE